MRDIWRPSGRFGVPARLWLLSRRAVVTLLAVGLLGFFLYVLVLPLLRPNAYMAYFTSGGHQPLGGQPVEFALEDFAALTPLEPALARSRSGESPLIFSQVESPEQFGSRIDDLVKLPLRSRDTLIVYLTAHGIVREDRAYLKCANFDAALPEQGLFEVSELLRRLGRSPAATKLLILDAGRDEYDPRLGTVVNTFPRVLHQEVAELNDHSVWVLTANSPLERSHVSPALRQSVFGYMLSRGLLGSADINENSTIQLDELYQFVHLNVSNWVKRATDGSTTQTPLLLCGEPRQLGRSGPNLLSIKRVAENIAERDVSADIAEAQSPDAASRVAAKVQGFVQTVSGQMGLSRFTNKLFSGNGEGTTDSTADEAAAGAEGAAADVADADADSVTEDEPEAASTSGKDSTSAEDLRDYASVAQRRLQQAWSLTASLDDTADLAPRDLRSALVASVVGTVAVA